MAKETEMTKFALFLVLFLTPSAGFSYPVHGAGSASCAEFAKMYQGDPEHVEDAFFSWAQGFMSGINLAAVTTQRPTRDLAGVAADQRRALRTYCANNPLRTYMDAVTEFYAKLPFSN
jgi:hypothetical protein